MRTSNIGLAILVAYAAPAPAAERLAWKIVNLSPGETVNMRSNPSTDASIVRKVPFDKGIISINGDCTQTKDYKWCPVIVDNQQGWIVDRYLQKVRLITRPAPSPTPELNLEEPANPSGPAADGDDEKGIFFLYHQIKPKKNPTGCMPVNASQLPPVDELQAVEGAVGKRTSKTICCEVEYVYFGSRSSCKAYLQIHAMPPAGEEEPITIPDEVNNL